MVLFVVRGRVECAEIFGYLSWIFCAIKLVFFCVIYRELKGVFMELKIAIKQSFAAKSKNAGVDT